jgi:arylformamidase
VTVPKLIDITPLISPRIAVWPGDRPFTQDYALRISEGANIDLSAIHTTVHLGAHADSPSHYAAGGAGIHERALDYYFGPCQVIAVEIESGARIRPQDLRAELRAPRVLFRTGSFPDPERWNEDFNSLSPELVHELHRQGVRLVGIDTPSVDPMDDAELLSHQALRGHDMANLEGLVLDHVEPGLYGLVALPLPIEGADASPVRAVLVEGAAWLD